MEEQKEEVFKEVFKSVLEKMRKKCQDYKDVLVGLVVGGWDQTVGRPWMAC